MMLWYFHYCRRHSQDHHRLKQCHRGLCQNLERLLHNKRYQLHPHALLLQMSPHQADPLYDCHRYQCFQPMYRGRSTLHLPTILYSLTR